VCVVCVWCVCVGVSVWCVCVCGACVCVCGCVCAWCVCGVCVGVCGCVCVCVCTRKKRAFIVQCDVSDSSAFEELLRKVT
jgi:hypothetical protein